MRNGLMMKEIHATLACNLDQHVLLSALPLLAAEKVDAIEWSFDALFRTPNIPDWFVELLRTFSHARRLVGHGIFFSLFSGRWTPEQQQWLTHLRKVSHEFKFDHITEHFGFMTGENFHQGAPISVPMNERTLAIGHDRLKRMFQACERPVGLENLAIAYSLSDVERQGGFLDQLLEPVNGFMILDVHNIYCQAHNFRLDPMKIMEAYPLDRVREIHISGGSWEASEYFEGNKIRRDTHNDAVPETVFEILAKAIPRCPNLKYVVLEQIGEGLQSPHQKKRFQQDFLRLREIIEQSAQSPAPQNDFLPKGEMMVGQAKEDEHLHQQQMQLSAILENAGDLASAKHLLNNSSLAGTDWEIEKWSDHMLDTVIQIAQKWKAGFRPPAEARHPKH